MAYGPKFSKTELVGGKNILASEHLEFVKGGATMDASKFDTGVVGVGKLVARNVSTGKFEPVAGEMNGEGGSVTAETHDTFSITNVDFENDGDQDMIVGEVIVRGSVYEEKLEDEVDAEFKAAAPLIQFINHA